MSPPKTDLENSKSWFDRLSDVFFNEPKNLNELSSTIKDAANKKIIDSQSLQMIEGVINVSQMQVRDIMIPRTQMIVIEHHQSLSSCLPQLIQSCHSRFPVIGDNDEVIGIVLAKDVLKLFSGHPDHDSNAPISRSLMRPAIFVPESKRLDSMLSEFKSSHNHLAIVVDEYGGVSGVVTIEDVLEQIVGNIEDEFDVLEDPMIIPIQNNKFKVNALTMMDDFNDFFKSQFADDEIDTIGGLISKKLGRIPQIGDSITLGKLTFKICEADERHIETMEVSGHESE